MKMPILKGLLFGIPVFGFASAAVAEGGITNISPPAHEDVQAEGPIASQQMESPETPTIRISPLLSDEELQGQRGGQSIQVANQTMTAITSGNILNGDYTAGAVTLSDNALSNFNGVGNLLINTGAQASLQTGMNLTIHVGE